MKGDTDSFGALLHEAWMEKKGLVKEITQDYFDTIYSKAIAAGSLGGKLLGAGGGGFFLFYVTKDRREEVIEAITKDTECRIYDFKFYGYGSRITAQC
jgi:D-glycero-alpha-D-manno-heptose-7-phosphate kinase